MVNVQHIASLYNEQEIENSSFFEQSIADILARSFMRSIYIIGQRNAMSSWMQEDLSFWKDKYEIAVIEWVKKTLDQLEKEVIHYAVHKHFIFQLQRKEK